MQVDDSEIPASGLVNLQPHLGHPMVDVNGPNVHPQHVPAPPPMNSVRQQIQERLDVLKIKECEIIRERLELNSRWNSSLAVTQLPNELLFHIFVYFSEKPEAYSEHNKYDAYHEDGRSFPEVGLAKTRWAKLMLVCRRWCEVARVTPALWRTIEVGIGRRSNWMKLALARSGGATIDVSFPAYFSEEHASLLQPHCNRLRSLRLRTLSPYVLRVVRNTLPALETLEIHSNPSGMSAPRGFYTDLGITRKRFPNLRILQLVHIIVPQDPLFYSGLRRLSLKSCPFNASLEQFVQLLSTCPGLEHLELDEFLQNLSGNGNVGPPRPLPSLLSLRLNNHVPIDSARFLSNIAVPQMASLSITARIGLPEDARGDTLPSIVPPNFATWLPGSTTVTWGRLVVTADEFAIECPSKQPGREGALLINLALNSPVSTDISWLYRMRDCLKDLLTLFGSAPLTRLEIVGDCSVVDAETWSRLFQAFPCLISLEADADGSLFSGLHDASLASDEDELVACRGLERIVINNYWVAESGGLEWILDPLLRCLHYRSQRGTRLEELHIDLRDNTDDIRNYLFHLEDLVSNVRVESAYSFAHSNDDEESEESFSWGSVDLDEGE